MAHARPEPPRPWTVADFLEWERQQEERYEFVDGVIRMMVGGTLDHNTIAGNIFATLRSRLRGGPCRAFMEGVKVAAGSATMYPDVVVTCAPPEPKDDVVREPAVVFEVLSRSTQGFDRGPKWSAYQGIPSLQQYVLVSQDDLRVEVFTRTDGAWDYRVCAEGAEAVDVAVAELRLTLGQIYEGSSLDPQRESGSS